jgi:hypothetical protein
MWNPLKKSQSVLTAYVDDQELCSVVEQELPCEKELKLKLTGKDNVFILVDAKGFKYSHSLSWKKVGFVFLFGFSKTLPVKLTAFGETMKIFQPNVFKRQK